jgi:hypothetical protein
MANLLGRGSIARAQNTQKVARYQEAFDRLLHDLKTEDATAA